MNASPQRPATIVCPQKPQGIESLTGSFERAQNLDRSSCRLNREDSIVGVELQHPQKVVESYRTPVEVEQGDLLKRPLPFRHRLELRGILCPAAGPSRLLQQSLRQVDPSAGLTVLGGKIICVDCLFDLKQPLLQI